MSPDALCLFALDASRPFGERVATALGRRACQPRGTGIRGRRAQGAAAGKRARQGRLRDPVALRRAGHERQRQAGPPAVFHRRPEGRLGRPGHRRLPLSGLFPQGPQNQVARPGQQPLCRPAVRGGGHRPHGDPRRPQPGRLSECLPHPGRAPRSPGPVRRLVHGTPGATSPSWWCHPTPAG